MTSKTRSAPATAAMSVLQVLAISLSGRTNWRE